MRDENRTISRTALIEYALLDGLKKSREIVLHDQDKSIVPVKRGFKVKKWTLKVRICDDMYLFDTSEAVIPHISNKLEIYQPPSVSLVFQCLNIYLMY